MVYLYKLSIKWLNAKEINWKYAIKANVSVFSSKWDSILKWKISLEIKKILSKFKLLNHTKSQTVIQIKGGFYPKDLPFISKDQDNIPIKV